MTRYLLLLLLSAPALAAPPPGSNPDSATAAWYHDLHVPDGAPMAGGLCCSIADCRNVQYRSAGDHFEAWIDSATFPDEPHNPYVGQAPNAWVVVPNEVVIKRLDNPTGEAVGCWYGGRIRCFVGAAGT